MSLEEAFKLAEKRELEAVKILRKLISINTCVPPGKNYDKFVDLIEPKFRELGFKTERVLVPEEKIKKIPMPLEGSRVNLVASREVGKETITLYAHMDTVPIDEEEWTVDPFSGVVREGRIYGRGACDNKGPIAGWITAFEIIKELGLEPRYDIICCVCTDEEIGIYPGIYHLALEGYVKGVVFGEGFQVPLIRMGNAGTVDVTVTTIGKSCHSGRNFMGVNALEGIVPILVELMKLKHEVEKRKSCIPLEPELVPKALEAGRSDKMEPMFNLNIIQSGTKSNVVPAKCTLVINRRYIPDEKYEDVIAEIQEAIGKGKSQKKALNIKVAYNHIYPPYKPDPNSKYVKRMVETLKLVQGYKDEDFLKGGSSSSTDMAFVQQALKTDKFVHFGPGRRAESRSHGADENIRVSDLTAYIKELIYYLCF